MGEGAAATRRESALAPVGRMRLPSTAAARAFSPIRSGWKLYLFAGGTLSLDDQKLRWKRRWFNVPFLGPRSFEVDLREITACTVGDSALAIRAGQASGLTVTTSSDSFMISVARAFWYSKEKCEEWRDAILEAVENAKAVSSSAD